MWSRRNVGWVQAALLFGVGGAVSSQLLFNLGNLGGFLLPIPFGIVAAWLCAESVVPGIALIILDAGIWGLTLWMAMRDVPSPQEVLPMCLAGLVGGLGVNLATALCKRRMPALRALGTSAVTGAVCGLPFAWWAWWVISRKEAPLPEWAFSALCFTTWQAAVGVCLWHGFRLDKPDPAT